MLKNNVLGYICVLICVENVAKIYLRQKLVKNYI